MLISAAGSIAGESPEKKKKDKTSSSSSSSTSSLSLLPDEILTSCIARVPRCYYSSISLVSKAFNRLVTSPEIYTERSVNNHTEEVIYVVLRSRPTETPRGYTLNQNRLRNDREFSNRLVLIRSFPSIPCWGMSMVALGSRIYVIGGCVGDGLVSTVFVVECPSHNCRVLPSMKQARSCAATGIIDGNLYVIGGCDAKSLNWIEVFDIEKESWESVLCLSNVEVHEKTIRSCVVDGKIYIMDRSSSFVYDPKEGSLVNDELLNVNWRVGSCVVDDKLYTFGTSNKILVFDPVMREWSKVKGLGDLPDTPTGSRMANRGGKLVTFCNLEKQVTEILCTEIGLGRDEGGGIRGTVLSSNVAIYVKESSSTIVQALVVNI